MSEATENRVVSTVNDFILGNKLPNKLFIYMRKSNGSRIDP